MTHPLLARGVLSLAFLSVLCGCVSSPEVVTDPSADRFSLPPAPEPLPGVYELPKGVEKIAEIRDKRPFVRIGDVSRGTLHIYVECTGEGQVLVSYARNSPAFGTPCGENGVTGVVRNGLPGGQKNVIVRVKKTNPDQKVRALVGWTDRAKRPKWLPKQTNPVA